MKEFAVYTALRLVLLAGSFGIVAGIWALLNDGRVNLFVSVILAFLISGVASYFVLSRQREAFAQRVEVRATKAAEARAQELAELVSKIEITVTEWSMASAVELAIGHYNVLKEERVGFRYDWEPAAADSDPEFLDRITVNFLRHECTTYDSLVNNLKGLVGKDHAYVLLRNRTLDAIAEVYPDLEWECEKQHVRDLEPWERELIELERRIDRMPS